MHFKSIRSFKYLIGTFFYKSNVQKLLVLCIIISV